MKWKSKPQSFCTRLFWRRLTQNHLYLCVLCTSKSNKWIRAQMQKLVVWKFSLSRYIKCTYDTWRLFRASPQHHQCPEAPMVVGRKHEVLQCWAGPLRYQDTLPVVEGEEEAVYQCNGKGLLCCCFVRLYNCRTGANIHDKTSEYLPACIQYSRLFHHFTVWAPSFFQGLHVSSTPSTLE